MMFLESIFLIALHIALSLARLPGIATTLANFTDIPPSVSKCNITTNQQNATTVVKPLQFRLPFMDMEMQNERNLHVMQELEQQLLFVVHGNELYQMFVSREQKRLALIGILTGNVAANEPVAAKTLAWRNFLLVVIALDEELEIYQISLATIEECVGPNAAAALHSFEPIQQLTLLGRFQRLFLTKPKDDEIMLIVAIDFTQLNSKLKTFQWLRTYFDPVEELTVQPIHYLNVVGMQPKYLLSGHSIEHQTVLTIQEIQVPRMKLNTVQTLTVEASTSRVHSLTFNKRNYLIACTSSQSKCNIFRMREGQFQTFKQRSLAELEFESFVAGSSFIVAVRRNEVVAFVNGRLNCYASFTAIESSVHAVITHRNALDESFILLNYLGSTQTLLRIVEIETAAGATTANGTDADDVSALHQHQHLFEETVGQLRSILLKRKAAMDVFHKIKNILLPKIISLRMQNPVTLRSSDIGIIKVLGEYLRSPVQLLQRIENMRDAYRSRRFVRSLDGRDEIGTLAPKQLKVRHLKVQNLIYSGAILEGFHLNNRNQTKPILSIQPKVTTKLLRTVDLQTSQKLIHPRPATPTVNNVTTTNTHRLNVERINNITWNVLYDTLFLRRRDNNLRGRLILQAASVIHNMGTKLLNRLDVAHLFNLKQPQVIESNLTVAGFFVNDLRAEQLNGLNFAEDVAFRGKPSLVETPVVIQQVSIAGNLIVANGSYSNTATRPAFQQYYTGKVVINGTLALNNLQRDDAAKTEVLLNDEPFAVAELTQNYLRQHAHQVFRKPVLFGNARVVAASLSTDYFCNHPTKQHLLTTPKQDDASENGLFIVLMSARVQGDVVCQNFSTDISKLNSDVVRHGEVANITANKIFAAPLTAEHVMTLELQRLPASELILKAQLRRGYKFKGPKHFEHLLVAEAANIQRRLNAIALNNLALGELLNHDYHFDKLRWTRPLTAQNVVFQQINGVAYDATLGKFNMADTQLRLHKRLLVEGNVQFAGDLEVRLINELAWSTYQQSMVRVNENAVLHGQKRFNAEVTITKALETTRVNGANMASVLGNVLCKNRPQVITGVYSFGNVQFTNLDITVINDTPTAAFIDMRAPVTTIASDVVVPQVTVHGDIKGAVGQHFNFEAVSTRLSDLTGAPWRHLAVHGNAHWNSTTADVRAFVQRERLAYLHKNAVRRGGVQRITGNVRLQRPLITQMTTKSLFPQAIDLAFLARDCIFKNTNMPQDVSGAKTLQPATQLANVAVRCNLQTPHLNQIDVLRLNASLYRLSGGEPIFGPLHFEAPPVIGHLAVPACINGLSSAQLYQPTRAPMPVLKMHNLIVEHTLRIQDINDMNLDYLLQQRVTKNGAALEVFGALTFANLILNEHIMLQTINGIPVDHLVFTRSNNLQAISGRKRIAGGLVLAGPVHVLHLNGVNLIDAHQQILTRQRDYYFDKLILDQATFEGGIEFTSDEKATATLARANVGSEDHMTELMQTENAQRRDTTSAPIANKNRFMYFDYDFETKILWQTPNEAVDKAELYELPHHATLCERPLLQLHRSLDNKRLYLSNVTTNLLTATAYNVSVRAENYCKRRYRKLRSKITLTTMQASSVFGMKKYIESVHVYAPTQPQQQVYVLLHALDLTTQRNEVRVLRVDNATGAFSDWQALTFGIGQKMHLFQFGSYTALVSAAVVRKRPALSIYDFASEAQRFKLAQTLDGAFDLIEMFALARNNFQLVVSCRHCQHVTVYEYVPDAPVPYRVLQVIRSQASIARMEALALGDGSAYLLLLGELADRVAQYQLYKYTHIQGWLLVNGASFEHTQLVVPVLARDAANTVIAERMMLLLCGPDDCRVVRAILQQ